MIAPDFAPTAPPIGSARADNPAYAEALFANLYGELRRMARRELARRGGYATLGATTLVHEAFLDISSRESAMFADRSRFLAYATRTMRGLIIDHVRRRYAHKRGGSFAMTTLDTSAMNGVVDEHELGEISEALEQLATIDSALAEVVDLKFFCGFSFVEIAAMRGLSERTVQRQWEKARLYLHRTLADAPPQDSHYAAR
jgi:RNA polymerase sigma factor (TIGR02999 family)